MTVHIGSLGKPRAAVDADFDWFGTRIRVHPDSSDIVYTDFLKIARNVKMDEATGQPARGMEQEAAAAVDDMLRGQIHPDDWAEFMQVAKANRQNVMDLMLISQQIVEAVAGFPTGQSSDSATGASGDQQRSAHGSSDRAGRRKAERKEAKRLAKEARRTAAPTTEHEQLLSLAARRLDGRPDLQLMVLNREEQTSAVSA